MITIKNKTINKYCGNVYDIHVKNEHSYFVENCCVHNSVGGSLTAYLVGITNVDPIRFGLLFSRFISPERNDMPDIDLDFERDRRDEVIEHIKAIYGAKNVVQITTYLSMKGKMALQDLARTFEISRTEMSAITKLIDEDGDLTKETFTESDHVELREFYKKHKAIIDYAIRIQGTIRGYGKHAAGVCISSVDLSKGDKCNFCLRNGSVVSNWDKDDSEYMGLMKMDILGLTALSRIHECLDLIKENYGDVIDLNSLTLDDKAIFRDLSSGNAKGVFQLGTFGITKFCTELGIDEFKDIYDATALFRPGTLGAGMHKEFAERKHGKPWKAIHPNVKKLTENTYGIIVYQEQVMIMARELAGFDWGKCDKMRKVIAKSKGAEEFNKFRDDFINGCVTQKTLSHEQAEKLFDNIVTFSSYSFNKCLTPDTTVETKTGEIKTLDEVQIGEIIKTPEGDSEIVNKYHNGAKEVYEIGLESGKKIKCTLDHKFLCENGMVAPLYEIIENNLKIMCELQ